MSVNKTNGSIHIREAVVDDVPIILKFIKDLAVFEKLSDKVSATEAGLAETLFGERAHGQEGYNEEQQGRGVKEIGRHHRQLHVDRRPAGSGHLCLLRQALQLLMENKEQRG